MKKFIKDIKKKAKENIKTIVLPESGDERILRATRIILQKKIAKIILVGDEKVVKETASHLGVNLKNVTIWNHENYPKIDSLIKEFYELRKKKGMTLEKASEVMKDPNYFATMLVHAGVADGLVSGATHTTADTVRPALQIIKTHEKFHKVSSFFFMMLEKKLLLFADCGIEIEPDAKDLADIAIDTALNAKKFGIEPKVALLSFSTAGSAKHPLVSKVQEATAIVKDRMPGLIVDGELQVDAALVPSVAHSKAPKSKIQGDANILIFPDLQSGNIAYKLVERLAWADAVGPILQGLKKPVNDLSRGCKVEDVVDVVAITAVEGE